MEIEFNEKFIDKGVAKLCEEYDKIRGQNVNIARITPSLIDGLKPVQRRALYIMFLKDGGKSLRKLATISGEVFGRVHPHSPTSIEDAIVNIAQPWRNILPLVEGRGNWGCHDDITEVLTMEGWKLFKDITKNDMLASVNPGNGEIIYEYPTEIFDYEYDGDLIVGSHKSIDFAVTPNHKMLIKKYDSNRVKFSSKLFVEAEDLPAYSGLMNIPIQNNGDDDTIILKAEYLHREYYKGHVYCAEVPTYHTLITRRNGIILVSGNSASGADAGASRYIYAKLSDYAIACFFEDWKESVVDTELAYDEETRMPEYLPAKYPNVLLNGCLGIGYGMSSNLPCFNFREVVEATVLLMLNPKAPIVLIPDSPTGADIIQTDFAKICEKGTGVYMQRCTYEIDPEVNSITITSLPDLSTSRDICNKIAEIKERGGLGELISMNDLSGTAIEIQLILRDDVNPYKFMRKLMKEVSGLQRSYPINVTVVDDYNNYDLSIKELLIEWIKWRREQKRAVLNNKRSTLVAEQRVTEVKMFIMNKNNLEDTIKIFRSSRNRQEIEEKLISKYKDTPIRMDSLQARALSNMRMVELTIDAYEACVKRAEELENELASLEETLKTKNGVDKIIIAELRDGVKRFGKPRNSNVVPYKISVSNEVEGHCILQLSADGNILRKQATNIEQEPIPTDSNGFACVVDNDASFILVDNLGMHTFVRAKDLPVDTEVPVFRYSKKPLNGSIVAMLPVDMESDKCCTIVSKNGIIKRIRINDIGPSKRPLISMEDGDSLIRGIVLDSKSNKKLIIYTKNGMGQLMENNSIKITSPSAKGGNGFKLEDNDEIIGIYAINPADVDYLLYITTKGKMRLNNIQFLPTRKNKHEAMVQLIQLPDRDKLLSIVGCNKLDVITVFYDDGTSEDININILPESTMSMEPKKVTKKNAVSNRIVKVKLK